MGRPSSDKKQRQLAVALPTDVRERLEAAANVAGHSLAEEVRQRVARTLHWDSFDPVTIELLEGLENLAALLRVDFGTEWYADPRAHQAFVTAVNQRLAAYSPPSTAQFEPPTVLSLVDPDDPPDTIGRMRERDDQRLSTYDHLIEIQNRKARHHDPAPQAEAKNPESVTTPARKGDER